MQMRRAEEVSNPVPRVAEEEEPLRQTAELALKGVETYFDRVYADEPDAGLGNVACRNPLSLDLPNCCLEVGTGYAISLSTMVNATRS
jgi:hypothetical protein